MQLLFGIPILLGVLYSIQSWHDKHDTRAEVVVIRKRAPQKAVPVVPSQAHTVRGGDVSGAHALIAEVADRYQVPAGALYGVWRKESGGLRSGWGTKPNWVYAKDMARSGSICAGKYGLKKCRYRWNIVRAICSQKRGGQPICDPYAVRTSYAMAMGPMQHMPDSLLTKRQDGHYAWRPHAVDHNGDGVFDPHDLGDSMAATARYLRKYYDAKVGTLGPARAWVWSANRYFGSQKSGYYSGRSGHAGVFHHWRSWCRESGLCDTRMMLVSSR